MIADIIHVPKAVIYQFKIKKQNLGIYNFLILLFLFYFPQELMRAYSNIEKRYKSIYFL